MCISICTRIFFHHFVVKALFQVRLQNEGQNFNKIIIKFKSPVNCSNPLVVQKEKIIINTKLVFFPLETCPSLVTLPLTIRLQMKDKSWDPAPIGVKYHPNCRVLQQPQKSRSVASRRKDPHLLQDCWEKTEYSSYKKLCFLQGAWSSQTHKWLTSQFNWYTEYSSGLSFFIYKYI